MDLATGIIAAPVLPLDESDSIDWSTLGRYMEGIAAGRPRAIAMNMAVSEVSSLSIAEQIEVIRYAKRVLADGCTLVSGVNTTNGPAAVELGCQMIEAGAEALVVFPPVPAFLGPVTVSMVEDFHGYIAEHLGVPLIAFETNFISYPAGSITALSRIHNVVSIKDASFNIDHTVANVKENAKSDRPIGMLTGSDTFVLEAMLMGCDGALIGLAATATAALVEMHELVAARKITEAFDIWDRIAPIARIGWRAPIRDYRVRMKYVLMRQGVIPNMRVRVPFPGLSEIDRSDLDEAFDQCGFNAPRFHPAAVKR
ncbi:dihydrodipicolinate synthase family protein [Paraburkholderia sp. Ac-20336]|uniref:dihydrodipicolinate synthase family protein n=1 Tax=Paraburkholderia sp. Ac-20336 TaxID=2703886 RepID=UPI00197DE225|nr:dihydrodipicolinate synthase family protein [Paraburkholderia sp. Ac-20336]MBN3801929.1 dihydrodipicolinate synthase family protein [Paraburkholderia sp. Ac-20336]